MKSRYRRSSGNNLNMSTRFNRPSTATSLPALSVDGGASDRGKKNAVAADDFDSKKKQRAGNGGSAAEIANEAAGNNNFDLEKYHHRLPTEADDIVNCNNGFDSYLKIPFDVTDTNSTSMIAAIFKSEAMLLEKRIQQFMAAQAERERIILEEERKTEEADTQR